MKSKVFLILIGLLIAGCVKADCDGPCTYYTSSVGQFITMTGTSVPCVSSEKKIPDLKTAPTVLPAYKERVLLWDGEEWQMGYRLSSDEQGEHWYLMSGRRMISKKRPMWQSLPPDPKDTPMCSGTADGKALSWKPKNGQCFITDATK